MTNYAREVWRRAESLHAVTYFADEALQAAAQVGFKGFWMGYFGFRAAPLGTASAALVRSTFYNFAPDKVAKSIPDAWAFATPADALRARAASAAATLRRAVPDIDGLAADLLPMLVPLVERADPSGRPLFAANQPLRIDVDPVADLWQTLTSWREHRGDSHIAALRTADLDGCEVHVLQAAASATPASLFQASRGWTDADWSSARGRLVDRGLADESGLSPSGHALKEWVEDSTDSQALRFFDGLDDAGRAALLSRLDTAARAVQAAGVLSFPNPIGLPRVDQ